MVKRQTPCSLGGTASLGLLLPYFILTIFSRKRLRPPWIVDIVKGIRSSLEELCESCCYIFLFLAIKSTLITVSCNVNVPGLLLHNTNVACRLLMSGDINPYPGPVSASINCLVMNARSLKSCHKDSAVN